MADEGVVSTMGLGNDAYNYVYALNAMMGNAPPVTVTAAVQKTQQKKASNPAGNVNYRVSEVERSTVYNAAQLRR